VYANASRGFRSTDNVNSDPTLPFITAWAYESGLKIDRGGFSGSAALFRMDVSDEQTFDPVRLETTAGGASRRQGAELGVQLVAAPGVVASGDWTITDAKYRQLVTDEGDVLSGVRVFNTATYVGTTALDIAPSPAWWTIRLSGNWVGQYAPFAEPGVLLGGYGLLHVAGSAKLARAVVQLGVRNVLDRAYPELRAGSFVAPGRPRTLTADVRYSF